MAVTTPASPASPRVATQVDVPVARIRTPRSGLALFAALVAVCAYAVFAHGAVGLPEEPRLQIGLAFVGVGAAIGLLLTRTLSLRAPVEVWVAIGWLVGFAVWCGITLLWSVAPERTWAHLNRAVAYTLVLVLALSLASSLPRAIERFAYGWLVVALACAFYGLAGKIIPGVEILGVSFNHTSQASRLRAPLEYWNALALVMVLAIPIALRMTTDTSRRDGIRLVGITSLFVLIVCLGMTYSRGGILAFLAAVTVVTLLGGQRLRGLAVIGVTIVAAIPVLGLSFSRPALKGLYVPLDERVPDGILLGLVSAGCILALLIGALGAAAPRGAHGLERRAHAARLARSRGDRGDPARDAARRDRRLRGRARRVGRRRLAQVHADRPEGQHLRPGANRLIELRQPLGVVEGGRRRVVGQAGAGLGRGLVRGDAQDVPRRRAAGRAAAQHAVAVPRGDGDRRRAAHHRRAGLSAVLRVRARARDGLRPRARHRRRAVRRRGRLGRARARGLGLGHPRRDGSHADLPRRARGHAVARRAASRTSTAATGTRAALLALRLRRRRAARRLGRAADDRRPEGELAQAVSANAGAAELEDAAAEADLAARLDPTAIRPLLASSAIAQGRGRLLDARELLLDAVDRQPYSAVAWQRLLELALKMADRQGARAAARRLLELDPIGTGTRTLAGRLVLFEVPAAGSPTATGTPLSPRYSGGPAVTPAPAAGADLPGGPRRAS